MRTRILDSTRHVYWNNTTGCYIALLSSIPTCTAEGATPAEALNNLSRTYAIMKGSYSEPKPRMPVLPAAAGRAA